MAVKGANSKSARRQWKSLAIENWLSSQGLAGVALSQGSSIIAKRALELCSSGRQKLHSPKVPFPTSSGLTTTVEESL